MDTSVLPEILALSVFIGLFQPIVARVRWNAHAWMIGWSFVWLHYAGGLYAGGLEPWHVISVLLRDCSLPMAVLFFLRAAANTDEDKGRSRVDWTLTIELAIPFLLQSTALALHGNGRWWAVATGALLLVPAMHVLLDRKRRRQPNLALSGCFGGLGLVVLALRGRVSERMLTDVSFLVLCLCVAAVYLKYGERLTRASVIAVIGLFGWGLSYVLADLMLQSQSRLSRSVLELPQYVFAAGVLMALIEQMLARIEHMAMHDALTGLPNRRLFEQHVEAAMAGSQATGTPLALLIIDVDEFKQINDTLGHHAGDELLRSLAVRLSWNIGSKDILARTGGDEFAAILAEVNDVHYLKFVAGAMMSAASVPFVVEGRSIAFDISIGVAVAPYDAGDILSLRKAADEAMYRAKDRGGKRAGVYQRQPGAPDHSLRGLLDAAVPVAGFGEGRE